MVENKEPVLTDNHKKIISKMRKGNDLYFTNEYEWEIQDKQQPQNTSNLNYWGLIKRVACGWYGERYELTEKGKSIKL